MAAPTPEDMAKWPIPNYENPHDPFDPVIYGVEIPLIVLMTLFIAGRFYSRSVLVKNALGVDDWVMLVAYVGHGSLYRYVPLTDLRFFVWQ